MSRLADRILVIGPTWVGDMVMAQSLYITVKRLRPDVTIDVVAPGWSLPLLGRMPEIADAIEAPFARGRLGLGDRLAFSRTLKARDYDEAIVLPNSFKSALSPWMAGIARRTGWRGEMRYGVLNDLRILDKSAFPLMVDRFNALAFPKGRITSATDFPEPHPYPCLRVDDQTAGRTAAKFGLACDLPVLALCPGAEFGPSKQWPPRHYAAVAQAAIASGHQVWLFGSAKDRATAGAVASGLPDEQRKHCHVLAGRTSLDEAVDLLSLAAAVVSNDSGLLHVAAAVGLPIVGVYGSTTPAFTPPLTDTKRTVRLGLACSPCFKRTCPLGHGDCMNRLYPDPVLAALAELDRPLAR